MLTKHHEEFIEVRLMSLRGNTSGITDGNFTAKAIYEYSDFGEVEEVVESIDNEICYTGAIHDETTGLHYMNARYYDPDNGRFISQDSYRGSVGDPGQWHLYVYCANNPINYTDPSGHFTVRRWMISYPVDIVLDATGIGAPQALSSAVWSLKYTSKMFLKKTSKKYPVLYALRTCISKAKYTFSKAGKKIATKIRNSNILGLSKKRKNRIADFVGNIATNTLYSISSHFTKDKALSVILGNLEHFTSAGSFIAMVLDYGYDKSVNDVVYRI